MNKTMLAMLAAFSAGIASASAQTFPTQPVHLVVPFPPGGGTDALARTIQEPFQKALGQSVIIDNRGGGGGHEFGLHEEIAEGGMRRIRRRRRQHDLRVTRQLNGACRW